jgi:pimeloyl-ACP methyl ester carboxylesterase
VPLIDANGARLHVQELGHGTPVVLLHGILLDNLATWYFGVAPRLAATHRVVLIDWRGHGRSETTASGYGVRELAADLAAVVDELGLERPSVVGYSYGGVVGLRYAVDRPDNVDRLVLVDAPLPVLGADGLSWLEVPLDEQPYDEWLALVPEEARRRYASGRAARRLHDQVARLYSQTSLRADIAADPDISDADLGRVTCPTLLAYGGRSFYEATRARLERRLPDTTSVLLDSSHFLPLEVPRELGDAIEEFLHG